MRQTRAVTKAPSPSYTSGSEFDSSNSDLDEDAINSGDDYAADNPDALWCLCRKPAGNKFMVQCEACKDWFHGKCVNVTEKDVSEDSQWYCPECDAKIKSGVPVSEIPNKESSRSSSKSKDRNTNTQRKSSSGRRSTLSSSVTSQSGGRRRGPGRPRKIDSLSRSSDGSESGNLSICLPSDHPPKSKSSSKRSSRDSLLDPKLVVKNGKVKTKSTEVVNPQHEADKLRRLIRDRQKEMRDRQATMEREKRVKANQLGIGCQPIAPKLAGSLDSLAASTAIQSVESPNKKDKSSKKPLVLQITKASLDKRHNSTPSDEGASPRVVTVIKTSASSSPSKLKDPVDTSVNSLFVEDAIQLPKKSDSIKRSNESIDPGPARKRLDSKSEKNIDESKSEQKIDQSDKRSSRRDSHSTRKSSMSSSSQDDTATSPTVTNTKPTVSPVTPTKRRDSHSKSSPAAEAASSAAKTPRTTSSSSRVKETGSVDKTRHNVRKLIRETLSARCKDLKNLAVESDSIKSISKQIEEELYVCFHEQIQKYLTKYRSLIFNLRDAKNSGLLKRVITRQLSPEKLVRMSAEELASAELAKWRERENKHSIELIKRDARLAAQQVILKKTHKGEEVISAPVEAEEPTMATDGADDTTVSGDGSKKSRITAVTIKKRMDSTDSGRSTPRSQGTSSRPNSPPLLFMDTTREHNSHVFDMNCRICTKAIPNPSSTNVKKEVVQSKDTQTQSNRSPRHRSQRKDEQEAPNSSITDNDESATMKDGKINENGDGSTTPTGPKRIRVSIDDSRILREASKITALLGSPESYADANGDVDTRGSGSHEFVSATNSPSWTMDAEDSQHPMDDGEAYDPSSPIDNLFGDDCPTSSKSVTKRSSNLSSRKLNEVTSPTIWSGKLTMPDVGELDTEMVRVSGDLDLIRGKFPSSFSVCGRINTKQVTDYIDKIKASAGRNRMLVARLLRHNSPDSAKDSDDNYTSFFDYLHTRGRYGVIDEKKAGSILKDFYLVPTIGRSHTADAFKPFDGPGLVNEQEGEKILLAVMVLTKQYIMSLKTAGPGSPEVSQHACGLNADIPSYNPTPIQRG